MHSNRSERLHLLRRPTPLPPFDECLHPPPVFHAGFNPHPAPTSPTADKRPHRYVKRRDSQRESRSFAPTCVNLREVGITAAWRVLLAYHRSTKHFYTPPKVLIYTWAR